jgi:hypothetical protein
MENTPGGVIARDNDISEQEIGRYRSRRGGMATENGPNSPEQKCLGEFGPGTKNRTGLFGGVSGKISVPHKRFKVRRTLFKLSRRAGRYVSISESKFEGYLYT